ncbi:hypothetical protein ES705_30961 [subsurface metagenome]
MPNPFEIVSAELMELKQVAEEFVQEHTEYAKLASYSHTIVWGSRGSGKSMHFRFMEPMAQACSKDTKYNGDVKEFLKEQNSFIGIYINCRDGVLNREELRLVESLPNANQNVLNILFSRYLSCILIKTISATISAQLDWVSQLSVRETNIPLWIKESYKNAFESLGTVLEHAIKHCSSCLAKLDDIVDRHFLNFDTAHSLDNFPSNTPRLTPDVHDYCRFLKTSANIVSPFFILFDEANELAELHQRCLNTLIAVRSQRSMCIKLASQRHGFVTIRKLESSVDETHDYTTIDLDGLYTNNRQAYYKRIERIGNERLQRAGFNISINEYLPQNEKEVEAFEKAKKIAEERYFSIEEKKRPIEKSNFIKKYAPAILFQEVLSPKGSKTYAGFDSVVHISSGIVRSFLDCCSKMYTRYDEKYSGKEPDHIPVSIQGEVIKKYSDEFIQFQIVDKLENLYPDSKEWTERKELMNLLKGLSILFRGRLMDKKSREPRIISISLKNDPEPRLQDVLNLAEREAFIHVKWYRSKRGNRNLRCYILNRRLCPHFNLDHTGFQGRLEVFAEELNLCLTDPDKFAKSILGRGPEKSEEDENQLTLFEW